jgi:uncharacterized protein YktA (UPF0223 family)
MRISKVLLLIICVLNFSSCSNNFFDFDEVEHYRKEITDNEIFKLYEESEKTGNRIVFLDIVENDYPENIVENFGDVLRKNGFNKTVLSKSAHKQINNLFSENMCFYNTMPACIPIYRDIIIFKKKHKTVGIAKICFDCELSYIIGTDKKVKNFGQCGDYEKLRKMLE